jgi:hypothetical protein
MEDKSGTEYKLEEDMKEKMMKMRWSKETKQKMKLCECHAHSHGATHLLSLTPGPVDKCNTRRFLVLHSVFCLTAPYRPFIAFWPSFCIV